MTADARTIAAYEANADRYAHLFAATSPGASLQAFIDALPKGARVLDLGCGPATASAFMRLAGLVPDPVDASPAMVALANEQFAIGARLASFDDIRAVAKYHGIWANFSLLHAERSQLPGYLESLHRALLPDGLFHIALKLGSGDARDRLDRFYCYYSREELLGLLKDAGFRVIFETTGQEAGLAGDVEPYIILRAHA